MDSSREIGGELKNADRETPLLSGPTTSVGPWGVSRGRRPKRSTWRPGGTYHVCGSGSQRPPRFLMSFFSGEGTGWSSRLLLIISGSETRPLGTWRWPWRQHNLWKNG